MEKENLLMIRSESSMRDIGLLIYLMVKESKYGAKITPQLLTKDNLWMESNMVSANIQPQISIMKVDLKIIKSTEEEKSFIKMVKCSKAILWTVRSMVMEFTDGQITLNLKASTKMISSMVSENSPIQVEKFFRVNGFMVSDKARE